MRPNRCVFRSSDVYIIPALLASPLGIDEGVSARRAKWKGSKERGLRAERRDRNVYSKRETNKEIKRQKRSR